MIARLFAFIGLTGPDGHLSFSKMVTLTVLGMSVATGTFGLGIAIAALSASFGVKAWLAFLQRHTSTDATNTTVDVAAVVKALKAEPDYRRDDERG
jgi:hypothetical protein